MSGKSGDPGTSAQAAAVSVTVHDIDDSQVIIGSANFALHLTVEGHAGYSDRAASAPLTPRPLAVINPRRSAPEPVGRAAVVEQAEAALVDGRSVQLCGTPGVGKTAVAEAVARRLAAASRIGVVLAGGRPRSELSALYSELAKVFFSVDWYEPDEAVLRAETGRHLPSGVIVVPDCELSSADAERLLGTFPDCVFLLCSPQQSLYNGEAVLDIEPLDLDATRALVERELGRPLAGFENLQVQHIYELGEGRISRVLVCAAFFRRASADARQYGVVPLSPQDQIAVLVAGISEPARRELAALCAFGPAPEELLGTLAGGLPDAGAAAEELEHAGLAAWTGGLFAATDDAREAMARQGWGADPRSAADELIRMLARARQEPDEVGAAAAAPATTVDLRLCVTVAQALLDAGDPDRASALSRIAAPAALALGDPRSWSDLVTIGVRAAREGGRGDDLVYFLTEEHTRSLLTGDRIAAAAALTAIGAALMHGGVIPIGPGAHHTAPPKTTSRPRTPLKQALQDRFGRGVATAVMIGAPIAVGAAAVGTGLGAAAVARPAASPAATTAPSATDTAAAAAVSSAAAGAAAAFPYGIGSSPIIKDGGGASPYEGSADIPVVTGMSDKALEQKINAELSGTTASELNSFSASYAGTEPGLTAPDPETDSETTEVFQTGRLISVLYLGFHHFAGAGDSNYGVTTVTVRTDTGDVINPAGILTAAATTSDLDTLISDLQAQPTISSCDDTRGGQSTLTTFLQGAHGGQPPFAMAVTSAGLLVYFGDGDISGTACRPTALLTWQQLGRLVNPEVLSLARQSPTGNVAVTPAPVPTPTGPPVGTAPATASTSASTSTPTSAASSPSPTDPGSVVTAYYAAINAHDYAKAWALGGKNLNSDYSSFSSGYGQTKSAVITIDSVSGSSVSVTLHATQTDGSQAAYDGTYTVTSGVITSADLHSG
ncbi:hypothetical protein ABH926_005880 [Catenulispora sp. GP43]|uniref:hypothetical protein n=1 Tax=Catenulispora sp. GP43 TaxID=3156263 RepID=UPI00351883EE